MTNSHLPINIWSLTRCHEPTATHKSNPASTVTCEDKAIWANSSACTACCRSLSWRRCQMEVGGRFLCKITGKITGGWWYLPGMTCSVCWCSGQQVLLNSQHKKRRWLALPVLNWYPGSTTKKSSPFWSSLQEPWLVMVNRPCATSRVVVLLVVADLYRHWAPSYHQSGT